MNEDIKKHIQEMIVKKIDEIIEEGYWQFLKDENRIDCDLSRYWFYMNMLNEFKARPIKDIDNANELSLKYLEDKIKPIQEKLESI